MKNMSPTESGLVRGEGEGKDGNEVKLSGAFTVDSFHVR